MARIVLKFGGTSVGDTDRIKNVARKVKAEVQRGNQVAVVVSAMSGATNQLVKWVNDIAPLHDPREYDVVVATGEQVTIGLLALALQQEGVKSRSWVSWQIPIKTDDAFAKARILEIDTTAMGKTMEQGEVPIVPGFQGVAPDGRITTLGRGGSDTSAVALAAASGTAQSALQLRDSTGKATASTADAAFAFDPTLNVSWYLTANNTGLSWSAASAWASDWARCSPAGDSAGSLPPSAAFSAWRTMMTTVGDCCAPAVESAANARAAASVRRRMGGCRRGRVDRPWSGRRRAGPTIPNPTPPCP